MITAFFLLVKLMEGSPKESFFLQTVRHYSILKKITSSLDLSGSLIFWDLPSCWLKLICYYNHGPCGRAKSWHFFSMTERKLKVKIDIKAIWNYISKINTLRTCESNPPLLATSDSKINYSGNTLPNVTGWEFTVLNKQVFIHS